MCMQCPILLEHPVPVQGCHFLPPSSAPSAAQRLAGHSSAPLAQQHSPGRHVHSTGPKADALGAVPMLSGTSCPTVLN